MLYRLSLLLALFVALLPAVARAGDPAGALDCSISRPNLLPSPEEMEVIVRTNAYRQAHGLAMLQWSRDLSRSAIHKAELMAATNNVDHNDSFRAWDQRFRDCGHTALDLRAENLAAGQQTPLEAESDWQQSPHHNENLLNPGLRFIGAAVLHRPVTPQNSPSWPSFWVMELASTP